MLRESVETVWNDLNEMLRDRIRTKYEGREGYDTGHAELGEGGLEIYPEAQEVIKDIVKYIYTNYKVKQIDRRSEKDRRKGNPG